MRFPSPLLPATLVRRYKRFLADVTLASGEPVTAHCANPGAMTGLNAPGLSVWLSRSDNPSRKLAHSLELVEVDLGAGPVLVGINTSHPNRLAEEAILAGAIPSLAGMSRLRREVRYGRNSRIDLMLEDDAGRVCYVEIKNVHLMREVGLAEFPDSVTVRGTKHLDELADMARQGHRAVMLYVVQRSDAERLAIAEDIDPAYAAAFARAREAGAEAIAMSCDVTVEGIAIARPVALAM